MRRSVRKAEESDDEEDADDAPTNGKGMYHMPFVINKALACHLLLLILDF